MKKAPWIALVLCSAAAVNAQAPQSDDPWARVRQLLSGVDLRVTASGKATQVKLDQVRDDALIVIQKNAQKAIARADIEKIELRMPDAKSRTKVSADSTFTPPPGSGVPNKTTTAGVTVGSRDGDYVLVYRRADAPAAHH